MVGFNNIIMIGEKLKNECEKRKILFSSSIVTNGTLLTLSKAIDLHKKANLMEIEVTLDGPKRIHDKRRLLKTGRANFDKILDTITKILQSQELKKVSISIRTNVDKNNIEYIDEFIAYMSTHRFKDTRISYYFSPVYSWSNDVSNVELKPDEYATKEIEWMLKMLKEGLNFSVLPEHPKKIVCLAVKQNAEVIGANGHIFSCTEHPLVDLHDNNDKLGDIYSSPLGKRKEGKFDKFNMEILGNKWPCSQCKLFGVCGGSCPKHWYEGIIPCPSIKHNIQQRLDIYAATLGMYLYNQQ